MHVATALRGQDRLHPAKAVFKQSLSIFSELGDQRVLANLHNCLGDLARARGD